MKITVIGTGNMGSGFANQLSKAGHTVRIAGRDLAKAKALADQYPNVTAYAASEALGDSDAVIIATAYEDAVPALHGLGDLNGKVVIDITNPLSASYMSLTIGHSSSAAEEIAKAVPQAHIVKPSTPCSPRCSPTAQNSPTTNAALCLLPPTMSAPNKRPWHWPKAWAGTPLTPVG